VPITSVDIAKFWRSAKVVGLGFGFTLVAIVGAARIFWKSPSHATLRLAVLVLAVALLLPLLFHQIRAGSSRRRSGWLPVAAGILLINILFLH
jgi:hypothetical protein